MVQRRNPDVKRFVFEGWICILIASVPDLCILFTFCKITSQSGNVCIAELKAEFIVREDKKAVVCTCTDYHKIDYVHIH